jgi:transposase-like protein
MKKNAKKKLSREAQTTLQLVMPLAAVVREELREFVIGQGMAALAVMLEEDRSRLCGPAYERGHGSGPRRAGSAQGELVMGGRRVRVKRPRVRDEDGEVMLSSWQEFASEDPLHDRALDQMMVGVSTRKYERSLEPLSADVEERGTSRSAVSRRFKAITEKRLEELLSQDLRDLPIAAIMIDGIHIDDHVILIALGIDEGGTKHVLGLWEGATENHKVCLSLLNNLVRRNLDVQRSTLFVIDGSGALRKAIRMVFGDYALMQRCQVHKVANVRDHLPKEMHQSTRKAMRDAYQASSVAAAKTRLLALAKQLATEHPGAAASLREGLDETLTVKGMGLTKSLEQTLSTTNPIENLNGGVRDVSRRVKRWRGGSMILRWVAAAALDRQKSFRRLRGYKGMPAFVAFLRRNDTCLHTDVDQVTEVA